MNLENFEQKYKKYKAKYLNMKGLEQTGGASNFYLYNTTSATVFSGLLEHQLNALQFLVNGSDNEHKYEKGDIKFTIYKTDNNRIFFIYRDHNTSDILVIYYKGTNIKDDIQLALNAAIAKAAEVAAAEAAAKAKAEAAAAQKAKDEAKKKQITDAIKRITDAQKAEMKDKLLKYNYNFENDTIYPFNYNDTYLMSMVNDVNNYVIKNDKLMLSIKYNMQLTHSRKQLRTYEIDTGIVI